MSLDADAAAVRTSVALTDNDQLVCVRVGGPDAQALVDRVSPRQLFVRSGQMLHTLLLDDDALPIADAYLCCDEDDFLVVVEGLDGPALASYLARHRGGLDVTIADLSTTHAFLSLDGPYAWELLAEITAPDVIGLPYLGFFHDPRFVCFRAGKTGEYGYDLLVERARMAEIRARIVDAGQRFELREIGLDALALCGLEAGFFDVRRDVRPGLTAVELQLQWRVSYSRTFPGSPALAAHRREPRGRTTMVASERELAVDATVELEGRIAGTLLRVGRSYTCGGWLAVALLDRDVAHAGLDGFRSGGAALATVSAPAVNNRSLYVDPQRHSWATREHVAFPPLVRPRWR